MLEVRLIRVLRARASPAPRCRRRRALEAILTLFVKQLCAANRREASLRVGLIEQFFRGEEICESTRWEGDSPRSRKRFKVILEKWSELCDRPAAIGNLNRLACGCTSDDLRCVLLERANANCAPVFGPGGVMRDTAHVLHCSSLNVPGLPSGPAQPSADCTLGAHKMYGAVHRLRVILAETCQHATRSEPSPRRR